jgi:colicin import membrane protein
MAHDEIDMLARARAEQEAMQARPADTGSPAADSQSPPAATEESEEARRQALDDEVRRRLQEAERQAELDQISERIRGAERSRAGWNGESPPTRQDTPPDAPADVTATPAAPPRHVTTRDAGQPATRATLLLVMEPGRRGIRRFGATADPILCTGDICYISRGADRDAQPMPRRRALGMLNTLGRRAGACNDSLECVFRNVDLGGATVEVQPIDLRILRHDRRRPLLVHADGSCGLLEGRLVCSEPAGARTWRVWTVPESIAREVGGLRLQAALEAGLRPAGPAAHGSRGVELRD